MSGPAAPANTAVPTINKNRLVRFSRPFNPSAKKNATPAVPARKWRAEGEQSDLLQNVVKASAINELVAALNEGEVERALAHKDPLDSTSSEAADLRSKRFQTGGSSSSSDVLKTDAAEPIVVDPATADNRSKRFGQVLSSVTGTSGAIVTVDVAPEVASKRESRFGKTAVALGVAKPSATAELSITEEEKKRLSRFQ